MSFLFAAYIDPGFGSILFQAAAAGLLGVVFFFRGIRLQVVTFFKGLFGKKPPNDPNPPATPDSKPSA